MRLTSAELLDQIEAQGGKITVLPDRSLECHNIPAELESELRRLQVVIASILLDPSPVTVTGEVIRPEKKPSRTRRRKLTCEICKSGQGCRTRGVREWQLCPACGHPCKSHFAPYVSPLLGEIFKAGCFWPREKCSCSGFPQKEKKARGKAKSLTLPFPEDRHEQPSECA